MYNVHDNLKEHPVEVLQAISQRDRLPFSIMLMNFEHDLNIGNCIRSAHLLGAESVIIFGKRKIDSRSTVGAHNYLNLVKVAVDMDGDPEEAPVISAFENIIKQMNISPIYIDKTGNSQDIMSADFAMNIKTIRQYTPNRIPCLIFGNEATGIHPHTITQGAKFYHIKQRGVIRSFNVASAASIVMFRTAQVLEGLNNAF